MASMGIFTAMMYREHLHDVVLAKAKELNPNMSDDELKKVSVPLPKSVSYIFKSFMHGNKKIVITAMTATDESGADMPCFIWNCGETSGKTSFEELPNRTMHRILDLLNTENKKVNPTVAMLNELSSVDKVKIYGNS